MRTLAALLCLALGLVLWTGADAGEKKEVTLKGNITCPKCELGTDAGCWTVIVVKDSKDDKKDLVYYFDKESNKKYHSDICTGGKAGTVVGIPSKEGKKLLIAVKKLEYSK